MNADRKTIFLLEFQVPVTEPDINNRLESLCLSMTEHALGGKRKALKIECYACKPESVVKLECFGII